MDYQEAIPVILISFISLMITLLLARWVFDIKSIVKYLRTNAFILKRLAEKNDALNEEDKEWVKKQLT